MYESEANNQLLKFLAQAINYRLSARAINCQWNKYSKYSNKYVHLHEMAHETSS